MVSFPSPALTLSFPAPALMLSLPALASMLSEPLEPMMVSFPLEAEMLMPSSLSFQPLPRVKPETSMVCALVPVMLRLALWPPVFSRTQCCPVASSARTVTVTGFPSVSNTSLSRPEMCIGVDDALNARLASWLAMMVSTTPASSPMAISSRELTGLLESM